MDSIELCNTINKRSAEILGATNGWLIYQFRPMLYSQLGSMTCLWDRQKNPIEQGILLAEVKGFVPCSYDALEESYKQVIKEMQTGWKILKPEDYAKNMPEGHDPEQLDLFVQSSSFTEISYLIAIIARKCGVAIHTYACGSESYMWIEKAKLKDVIAKMGFQL